MEKVFSSPDEEGHLLSYPSLSAHRLTPTASSGPLLSSAAEFIVDSHLLGPGLDLLLTCALGLSLAPRVVFHVLIEFCVTALRVLLIPCSSERSRQCVRQRDRQSF